ncbi:MAG TPA: hypothetical protein VJS15_02320 [Allosphingosinicella sp.]|nr:hypothetical protein [Allosphingosinicella sp.]
MKDDGQDGGEDRYVARGKNGRQVRKRRRDGWTRRARQGFLDHFRATCNAAASARAAGRTEGSAHKLRARDPDFAAEWDAALVDADARLTGKLILFAETRGKPQPETDEAGEPAVAPIADFDPELALKLLRHHRSSLAGRPRRGGPKPKRASNEELIGAVVTLLGLIKRRRARQAARGRG